MHQPKTLFSGLVEIKSLILTDQPATRSEVRARITTSKGEMAVLSDTNQVIRHLAYLELREGQRRGDHYHKLRHEYLYLISGNSTVLLEEIATGTKTTVLLDPGDLIFIQPGIAHTFIPISTGHALEFAAEPFDLSDVHRHSL